MNLHKTNLFIIFIFIITLNSIISCSNISNNSSTSSTTNLGNLPNGSTIYVSSANFNISTISSYATGIIGISNGLPNYTGILTIAIEDLSHQTLKDVILPNVSLSPKTCKLVAGNLLFANCQIKITIESEVMDGVYSVIPTFTPTNGGPIVLNSFTVTVSGNPQSEAGNLAIILESANLRSGESTIADVLLTNSNQVNNVIVNLVSTAESVVAFNKNVCVLSSESNLCRVIVTGLQSGTSKISLSSPGYQGILSNPIVVNSSTIPGDLSIHLDHQYLQYAESMEATISLIGSANVEGLTVNVASSNESIATVSTNSCVLSSLKSVCKLIISALNESGIVSITESASGYTSSSDLLSVIPPTNLYFGTSNGLIYSNNEILKGNAELLPDGGSIDVITSENGVFYIGTANGNVFTASNGIWYQIGNSPAIPGGRVVSLIINGKNIYAGGYSKNLNSGVVYVESGLGWHLVGESVAIPNGAVSSIAIKDNIIYAAGATILPNSGVVYMESGNGWKLVNNYPPLFHGYILSLATSGNNLYAGGRNLDSGSGVVFVTSGNGVWERVGRSAVLSQGEIYSIAVDGNTIYSGGEDFNSNEGVVYIESGNGWELLNNKAPIANGEIYTIKINNNNLYAAGVDRNSRVGVAYQSLANDWHLLGESAVISHGQAFSIAIDENQIYVGGDNGSVQSLSDFRWNPKIINTLNTRSINALSKDQYGKLYAGTIDGFIYTNLGNNWQMLGNSAAIPNGQINSIIVDHGKVYVGGFVRATNSGVVYVESGGYWSLVGDSNPIIRGEVTSLAMDDGHIYAGGYDENSDSGVVYVESDRGWHLVNESAVILNGEVYSILIHNHLLYAGGFDENQEAGVVYIDSGNKWKLLGGKNPISIGYVKSLAINGNNVYAGGIEYDSSMKLESSVVYMESGNRWKLLGGKGVEGRINAMQLDANQDVYVATNLNSIYMFKSKKSSWEKLPYFSYYSGASIQTLVLDHRF